MGYHFSLVSTSSLSTTEVEVDQFAVFVSSEGALIAITPYDYPQQHPLFEHTPVLDNNLSINATMTLVQ